MLLSATFLLLGLAFGKPGMLPHHSSLQSLINLCSYIKRWYKLDAYSHSSY